MSYRNAGNREFNKYDNSRSRDYNSGRNHGGKRDTGNTRNDFGGYPNSPRSYQGHGRIQMQPSISNNNNANHEFADKSVKEANLLLNPSWYDEDEPVAQKNILHLAKEEKNLSATSSSKKVSECTVEKFSAIKNGVSASSSVADTDSVSCEEIRNTCVTPSVSVQPFGVDNWFNKDGDIFKIDDSVTSEAEKCDVNATNSSLTQTIDDDVSASPKRNAFQTKITSVAASTKEIEQKSDTIWNGNLLCAAEKIGSPVVNNNASTMDKIEVFDVASRNKESLITSHVMMEENTDLPTLANEGLSRPTPRHRNVQRTLDLFDFDNSGLSEQRSTKSSSVFDSNINNNAGLKDAFEDLHSIEIQKPVIENKCMDAAKKSEILVARTGKPVLQICIEQDSLNNGKKTYPKIVVTRNEADSVGTENATNSVSNELQSSNSANDDLPLQGISNDDICKIAAISQKVFDAYSELNTILQRLRQC